MGSDIEPPKNWASVPEESRTLIPPMDPILPIQPRHPSKLSRVGRHQRQLVPQRLPRNQHIISPNRLPFLLQFRAYFSCPLRVLTVKLQHLYRTRKKCLYCLGVRFLPCALRHSVPQFKGCNGGHKYLGAGIDCLLKPNPHRRTFSIDQRNTGACIQQVAHGNLLSQRVQSKIFRRGVAGCFLPSFINDRALTRSSSANHLATSGINVSSRTPSGTRRTRTLSPSNRNSRGSRTAWLRPLRNSFATPLLSTGHQRSRVYTINLYHHASPFPPARLTQLTQGLRKGWRAA
jgi:hypothetical protein